MKSRTERKSSSGCLTTLLKALVDIIAFFLRLLWTIISGIFKLIGKGLAFLNTHYITIRGQRMSCLLSSILGVILSVVALVVGSCTVAFVSSGLRAVGVLPTYTSTPTITPTPTPTYTPIPTDTPTITPTPRPTNTPTVTPTPAPTNTPTLTPTPRPTNTSTPTLTPTPAPVGSVSGDANLRAGPGTGYDKIGSVAVGESVEIVGITADGEWYQIKLASSEVAWLAAFLLSEAEDNIPIPTIAPHDIPPTPTPTNTPRATNTPRPTNTPVATPTPVPQVAKVIIKSVRYDGLVKRVESDEYAEIANVGNAPINIGGWRLNAGDPGQDFTFPGFDLQPGQSCRVYTNEYHAEHCGFSFGIGRAIWNNGGDCGFLYDASGAEVSKYCY